jgi:hypothetical protein
MKKVLYNNRLINSCSSIAKSTGLRLHNKGEVVEAEKFSRKISKLPPEAQRQVKDFIAFLSVRYKKKAEKRLKN